MIEFVRWLFGFDKDEPVGQDSPNYTPDGRFYGYRNEYWRYRNPQEQRQYRGAYQPGAGFDATRFVDPTRYDPGPQLHVNEGAYDFDRIRIGTLSSSTITNCPTITVNGQDPDSVTVMVDGYNYRLIRDDCEEED